MSGNTQSLGDVAGSAMTALALITGYLGAAGLFLGGLSTLIEFPIIGQIHYMNGQTGTGVLYIITALASGYLVYTRRYIFLYLTGGIAGVLVAYDILNGTRIGYIIGMALGGGLTGSMGGAQDPIVSEMMKSAGFSIPLAWMVLAGGIFLLLITPNMAEQKPSGQKQIPQKNDSLESRLKEIDNLILIYERGHITKEEFSELKKEIMKRNRD
ncbi:MAG TPA: hypothetical protein VN372_03995 [Methanospirillum sp.]|nr:hypothetical protein [Methanospirillum sp.]